MQPLLITGATGTLGRAFASAAADRGLSHHATSRGELDITSEDAVAAALHAHRPWLLVNAAGFVRVDDAEANRAQCFRDNVRGPEVLARACACRGVQLITFSSDLVFDGAKASPYLEHDVPRPLGVYGHSKHDAERRVLANCPDALVVRTSSFFGPEESDGFVALALRTLAEGRPFRAAGDVTMTPTYVPDLVHACLGLAVDGARGLWHLTNGGALTWAELARRAAVLAGLPSTGVVPVDASELAWRAARPRSSALGSVHGALLPSLDDALARHERARRDRTPSSPEQVVLRVGTEARAGAPERPPPARGHGRPTASRNGFQF
jgi:dTDP-4-dehydrorhamnose reductase